MRQLSVELFNWIMLVGLHIRQGLGFGAGHEGKKVEPSCPAMYSSPSCRLSLWAGSSRRASVDVDRLGPAIIPPTFLLWVCWQHEPLPAKSTHPFSSWHGQETPTLLPETINQS